MGRPGLFIMAIYSTTFFVFFRYDTVVQDSFRVTKACIEPATAADKVTSLYLEHDAEEFIVANLDKKNLNEDLDIAFTAGEKIGFKVPFVK